MTNPTDIVVFGTGNSEDQPLRPGRVAASRRLRRYVEPMLMLVVAAAMFLVGQASDDRRPPAAGAAVTASTARVATVREHLIAPRTAAPGEPLTVLAYRNARLCGPIELRFDGAAMRHRLAWYAGPRHPDRTEMALAVWVPRSAKAGRHEIELWGPVPGGQIHNLCGDRPEHQARLDTTTIMVVGRLRG